MKGCIFRKNDLDSLRKSGKGILGGGKNKGEDVEGRGSRRGSRETSVEATAVFQANNGVCSDRDSSGKGRKTWWT